MPRVVRQGEIYWIDIGEPEGSEVGYRRPYVIIQSNFYNQTKIETILTCPLTSNLRQMFYQANVPLEVGEAGLSKRSVVLVSQIEAVERTLLGEYVGLLSSSRVRQIVKGIYTMLEPRDAEEKPQI